MDSSLQGFYKKSVDERLDVIAKEAGLTAEEKELLKKYGGLDKETANRMIENVFTTTQLPLGIATNFKINGKDYLVPFALEEPSVVAAASNAAKLCRESGGFTAEASEPVMIGQIQLVGIKDIGQAAKNIAKHKKQLVEAANALDQTLVSRGGGVRDVETKALDTTRGKMLIVHLLVDVRDAMGANAINTMSEALTPRIEELTGGQARLRIISNLAVHRIAKAKAVWTRKALEESVKGEMAGEEVVEHVLDAYAFAEADPFRACTHNKGIMNGVDALAIATGNDWRGIEAGAHSYAWYKNKAYKPLTKYYKNGEGNLVGEIEIPAVFATVGGATRTHPVAKIALKILGVQTAQELACVAASVGLAQNFAAMRALATEGINKGHMKLHASNFAVMAGAKGGMIDKIAKRMIEEKKISHSRAVELLKELSSGCGTLECRVSGGNRVENE